MDIHRKLVKKGVGSSDWINEWTEVKYLGGRRFAMRIHGKPLVFRYKRKWLKHKLIKGADKTLLISANAGVLIKSNGDVTLIDPKHRKIRVLKEEFAVLALVRGKWVPILATTKGNLVKIESFEENDRICARITFANKAGELVVEYLLTDGHMLKYNIKFTAKRAGKYRLVQGWLIPVKRVRVWKEMLEEYEITGRKELPPKIAIGFMHEGVAVTGNLIRLFEEDPKTGELKSKIVKKITLDLEDVRGKVAILYGDWTLGAGEAFELDPETTTISPPTDDSWVAEWNKKVNYGTNDELRITDRSGGRERSFIKFDLSGLPSGIYVWSAKVRLYYHAYSFSDPAGKQADIHRVTESWSESSVNWNNQPSYASTPTSSINIPSSYGWVEWDVTDDVQDMVDGTVENYGWCIKFHTEGVDDYSKAAFCSKEYDGYDPELYVEYQLGYPYTKEVSDAVVSSDAVNRGFGISRLDAVKGVDAFAKKVDWVRNPSDALLVQDVFVKKVSLVEMETAKAVEVVKISSTLLFSGVVQTPLGDPYPGAKVLAIDEETWEIVGEATSDVNGQWSMVLPGGRRYTFVAVGAELNVGADAKAHVKY